MGYQVKWVQDNLGISRKTLRVYEKKGLIPLNFGHNRNYSDEDLWRIWTIRVLFKIGFDLSEIPKYNEKNISEHDTMFNFQDKIAEKISKLEQEKEDLEHYIGYAKYIKFTGRFPHMPKDFGHVKFDDFHRQAMSEWNMNNDPELAQAQELCELYVDNNQKDAPDIDVVKILEWIDEYMPDPARETAIIINYLYQSIIQKINLPYHHSDIQTLIKMISEQCYKDWNVPSDIPYDKALKRIAWANTSSFLCGDIAQFHEKQYGKTECEYIANAFAYFAGFSTADEALSADSTQF